MLKFVEMSCQEAAWFLLRQPMSHTSRDCIYIPTFPPNERLRSYKKKSQLDAEEQGATSTNIWMENIIEKYEKRPSSLATMCLADLAATMTLKTGRKRDHTGTIIRNVVYCQRDVKRVLRWTPYNASDEKNYKRSMVLLFIPFINEHLDLLDHDSYLRLYTENELIIAQRLQQYEVYTDFENMIASNRELWSQVHEIESEQRPTVDHYVHQEGDLSSDANGDIRLISSALTAVVKRRSNVLPATEYCTRMRCTNFEQRALLKHCIARIHDCNLPPVQVFFSGNAGTGKTFFVCLSLMQETFNRFVQAHDITRDVYVAAASTGKAAVALGGTTVHSAFNISISNPRPTLNYEMLHLYRNVFANVQVIFVDEISMIGSPLFHLIDRRLKQISGRHDVDFGGFDIIFSGDLRQLPAVRTYQIFEPPSRREARNELWQNLKYYPLQRVSSRTFPYFICFPQFFCVIFFSNQRVLLFTGGTAE